MDAIENTSVARSALGTIFHYLLWPVGVVYGFFSEWSSTRNWRWFFVSIPALIVGILVAVGLAQAFTRNPTLASEYTKRAQQAYNTEDYARAEMLYRKAGQYSEKDLGVTYSQGLCLSKLNRVEDAIRVMGTIAPLEMRKLDGRFPEAHLWFARGLLLKEIPDKDPVGLAEQHLRAILQQKPNHIEAHRILADLALSRGNGAVAIVHLEHVVSKYPKTRIIYAQLLDMSGQKEAAKREASNCFNYYKKTLPPRVNDKLDPPRGIEWVNWSRSAALLDRFVEARDILKLANKHCDEKKVVRQGIAQTFVRWSNRLDSMGEPSVRQRLELLGEALRIAPDNAQVLQSIALLVGQDEGSDPIAEEMLKKSLATGTAPAIVHFLLGTRAATEGNPEDAMNYLEQALRLNPNVPVVLNNLAWVLMEKGDIDNALVYAKKAVKLREFHPNFRETLGQILIKKAQKTDEEDIWRDAISELNRALTKMKDRPEIHKSLALAYARIGLKDEADSHQTIEAHLRRQLEEKKKADADATSDVN